MKANKIIKGLTLLLIGLVLLANSLEILDWAVWSNIFKLWPLLLVSLGISLIFKDRSLSFLSPLIIFLAILIGVTTSYTGISFEGEIIREVKTLSREIVLPIEKIPEEELTSEAEMAPETEATLESEVISEAVVSPEITKASIALEFSHGEFTLNKATNLLYECISQYRYKAFEPFEEYSLTENEANILISHLEVKGQYYNAKNDWKLKLNNQIIYDLSIKSGAISANCDLSNFNIEKVLIKSGVSNINLIAPKYNSKITIDTGVSNIDIGIPKNVGARIIIDSEISTKNLDNFIKADDVYLSNNYNNSEFKTDIEIDCAVSRINIYYTDMR